MFSEEKKCSLLLVKEKKTLEIDSLIDPCLKKRRKKTKAYLFPGGSACRSLVSELTLTSKSTNPVSLRVVFVFLRKNCVFEEEEQKSSFLSPKKKVVRSVSSRVRAVYKPYPKSLTYYMVNDTPRGVSDKNRTRVRVSNTQTLHKIAVSVFQRLKPLDSIGAVVNPRL